MPQAKFQVSNAQQYAGSWEAGMHAQDVSDFGDGITTVGIALRGDGTLPAHLASGSVFTVDFTHTSSPTPTESAASTPAEAQPASGAPVTATGTTSAGSETTSATPAEEL